MFRFGCRSGDQSTIGWTSAETWVLSSDTSGNIFTAGKTNKPIRKITVDL
jgi:hypothetical protein